MAQRNPSNPELNTITLGLLLGGAVTAGILLARRLKGSADTTDTTTCWLTARTNDVSCEWLKGQWKAWRESPCTNGQWGSFRTHVVAIGGSVPATTRAAYTTAQIDAWAGVTNPAGCSTDQPCPSGCWRKPDGRCYRLCDGRETPCEQACTSPPTPTPTPLDCPSGCWPGGDGKCWKDCAGMTRPCDYNCGVYAGCPAGCYANTAGECWKVCPDGVTYKKCAESCPAVTDPVICFGKTQAQITTEVARLVAPDGQWFGQLSAADVEIWWKAYGADWPYYWTVQHTCEVCPGWQGC